MRLTSLGLSGIVVTHIETIISKLECTHGIALSVCQFAKLHEKEVGYQVVSLMIRL